jgi:hypothetical protein
MKYIFKCLEVSPSNNFIEYKIYDSATHNVVARLKVSARLPLNEADKIVNLMCAAPELLECLKDSMSHVPECVCRDRNNAILETIERPIIVTDEKA